MPRWGKLRVGKISWVFSIVRDEAFHCASSRKRYSAVQCPIMGIPLIRVAAWEKSPCEWCLVFARIPRPQ